MAASLKTVARSCSNHFWILVAIVWLAVSGFAILQPGPAAAEANPLRQVRTWMYLLQRLEVESVVAALAASNYDMLVIEPGLDFKDGAYPTETLVKRLSVKPSGQARILLAYVDIGQAEDFRAYWGRDWRAPKPGRKGHPEFLVAPDPDGWSGDYGVAFWHPDWKNIWLGPGGLIARLAKLGFDGVYMDWVAAYEEPAIVQRAKRDGVDPAAEMVRFIAEIKAAGRRINPRFLIVAQNAVDLIEEPGYAQAIDGLAVEDTWFRGAANAAWTSKRAGDLPPQTEGAPRQKIEGYRRYLDRGLPVFTVDYCVSRKNAARVYAQARQAGLVPLVTRVSLDHLTETPPP
jgi:cysteinyl-tRNA synthetase